MTALLLVRPARCPNCDYDLTGLPEPRCPECGHVSRSSDIVIQGWYKKQNRAPKWVRALQVAAAVLSGVGAMLVTMTLFAGSDRAIWPLFVLFGPCVVAVWLIGFIFRHRAARADTIVVVSDVGLSLSMRERRATRFHHIAWRDIAKVTIRRSGRRLHSLRFRARSGLDRVLSLLTKVHFECDVPKAQALQAEIERRMRENS